MIKMNAPAKYILCFFSLVLFCHVGFASGGSKKKLYVYDRKIVCAGNYECMQVKEKAKEAWHVYTDTIEGFNYQEGYNYTILVETTLPKNPYEGRINDKYKLVKVISKIKTDYNPAVKLEGKKWMLLSMNDGKKNLTFNQDSTRMSVQFNVKAGKVTGHGICNTISGTLAVQNNAITITNIASTKMMCAGQGGTFEKIYRDFLAKASAYEVSGNRLYLKCNDGSSLLFQARMDE
jgi:heat shock protein HslJ